MKFNITTFSVMLIALIFLPSCLKIPNYKPRSLSFMHNKFMHKQTKNNVILQIKKLEEDEKSYIFGEHKEKLEEYSILYFSLHNLSSSVYQLVSDFTDLSYISYSTIIKEIKTSTIGRATIAGAGIAGANFGASTGILLFGLVPFSSGLVLLIAPFSMLASGTIGLVGLGIGTSFIGKTIKSMVVNSHIAKDLKKKIFSENLTIPSGGFYEGLIIVKTANFKEKFAINLHEKNTATGIQFNVEL